MKGTVAGVIGASSGCVPRLELLSTQAGCTTAQTAAPLAHPPPWLVGNPPCWPAARGVALRGVSPPSSLSLHPLAPLTPALLHAPPPLLCRLLLRGLSAAPSSSIRSMRRFRFASAGCIPPSQRPPCWGAVLRRGAAGGARRGASPLLDAGSGLSLAAAPAGPP